MDQFALICLENWNFQQHPLTFRDHYSRLSDEDVLIFTGKISKLSTTFIKGTFPKYVPLAARIEFSDDRSFETDSIQEGKTERKILPL
jgi:hypothetical protein